MLMSWWKDPEGYDLLSLKDLLHTSYTTVHGYSLETMAEVLKKKCFQLEEDSLHTSHIFTTMTVNWHKKHAEIFKSQTFSPALLVGKFLGIQPLFLLVCIFVKQYLKFLQKQQ